MINQDVRTILHARIILHCENLFDDGHYCHACQEACKQVELAMKERTGTRIYGRRLAAVLKGDGKGIKLKSPFGPELQNAAASYFDGAFQYYRNYSTHSGDKIDRISSLRSLVATSELLELIGASDLSFHDIGGVQGLIDGKYFVSKKEIVSLLQFLDNQNIIDDVNDGFFESLYDAGFSDDQMGSVLDLGLMEYEVSQLPQDIDSNPYRHYTIGVFQITPLGKQLVGRISKEEGNGEAKAPGM